MTFDFTLAEASIDPCRDGVQPTEELSPFAADALICVPFSNVPESYKAVPR